MRIGHIQLIIENAFYYIASSPYFSRILRHRSSQPASNSSEENSGISISAYFSFTSSSGYKRTESSDVQVTSSHLRLYSFIINTAIIINFRQNPHNNLMYFLLFRIIPTQCSSV